MSERRTDWSMAEYDELVRWSVSRKGFPSWFVPLSGFAFRNRDALVVVCGYGSTAGHGDANTLIGAMDCGGQWAFVNLSTWGDEWPLSGPINAPTCCTCLRVDCPTIGGVAAACAPITWSNP